MSKTKDLQKKNKQLTLLKALPKAYGGDLLKKHKARQSGRPLDTRNSMHFVLRSTQAKGEWSFRRHQNEIRKIIERFAIKFGVRLFSMANVGNHLHLHLQLTNRFAYDGFIRAISSAIMMRVTGISRWNKIKLVKKFWDCRPFSRVIIGFSGLLKIRDYIAINKLEGIGYTKTQARFYLAWQKDKSQSVKWQKMALLKTAAGQLL